MRSRIPLAVCAVLVAVAVPEAPASASSTPVTELTTSASVLAPAASSVPGRLRGLGNAEQVIVVTDPRDTSYATLTAYERGSSGWRIAYGPMSARIGANGFVLASQRRQGTSTTPAGSFTLGPSFGNGSDPGTRMRYRVVSPSDRWVYDRNDPSTYNTYQPSGDWGNQERLYYIPNRQYRYSVVIGFNHPRMVVTPRSARPGASPLVDTRLGGGIFLHVKKRVNGESRPTAGCVSVDEPQMRALLRWLNPAKHPRIIMGPRSVVFRSSTSARSITSQQVRTGTIGMSRDGRPIKVVRIGPDQPTRRLVVIGVIHGSEPHGSRVVSSLRSMRLPPGLAVWLVPTMNPDGLANGSRRNSYGVDLNRNFPRSWLRTDPGSSTYSGPSAASEPETRAVMKFLNRIDPSLVVIFHSPLNGVDSYGAKSMAVVNTLSKESGFPVGSFSCSGGCHGTLTQWFNGAHNGAAVTFEFGPRRPSDATVARVARAVVAASKVAP